jgi:hypothetical protein
MSLRRQVQRLADIGKRTAEFLKEAVLLRPARVA